LTLKHIVISVGLPSKDLHDRGVHSVDVRGRSEHSKGMHYMGLHGMDMTGVGEQKTLQRFNGKKILFDDCLKGH
jgi:hypothetical protein